MSISARKTGIAAIGDCRWGTHFCLFYHTQEDLIDILVPYFKAGLENNEFCMWVTSEPLQVEEAKSALAQKVEDLDHYIRQGQIEILNYTEWYTQSGSFEASRVLQGWVEKEQKAIDQGWDGLRLTGNTFWLEKEDWRAFSEYEAAMDDVIGKYRMIALCTYSLDRCGTTEIIDMVANHQFALIGQEGQWRIVESSERRRAEQQIRLQAAALESVGNGVVITDRNGTILWVNPAFTRLTGYTHAESIGQNPRILKSGKQDRSLYQNLWECILSGSTWRGELINQRKDGSLYVEEMVITPVREENGELGHFIAVKQDITTRKQAEEALQEANRRKDEFLATLSHELRNPLAAIASAVQILRLKGEEDPMLRHAQEVAERQTQHMKRLLDDLLDISRITRGKVRLQKELVDLATIVSHAVKTSSPLMQAQGHELSIHSPLAPLRLEADPVRLEQVLTNLLNNAAKYTPKGGHIRLFVDHEGDQAILRVRDNGIGISPEILPNIFDLFVQADHSLARSQGGLGIGLTLVRGLVEMHGGTVAAYSAGLGKGSEFVVRIPALPATFEPTLRRTHATEAMSQTPRRLLLVDDNEDAAVLLATLLRMKGHDVRVVYDGLAALAAAAEHRPEVVLLDIGLPGMDGYEVARRIRQHEGLRRPVLIAMTGYSREEDLHRAKEAGFDHHLAKPVEFAALLQLLP